MKTTEKLPWNIKPGMQVQVPRFHDEPVSFSIVTAVRKERGYFTCSTVWVLTLNCTWPVSEIRLHGKTRSLPPERWPVRA